MSRSTWLFYFSIVFKGFILILGRTRKFIQPPWHKGGGGMDGIPLPSFWYVAVFRNNFTFSGKPLIFLTRLQVYFVGGGAAGGLWRHQQWSPSWLPSWILPRIRNQVKTAGNSNFCDGLILFLKKVEKTCISPKIGLTNCTFDVISRNHSTWPSLNLSQNLREGWTNSYRKRQVLMFYPVRKLLIRTPAKNVFEDLWTVRLSLQRVSHTRSWQHSPHCPHKLFYLLANLDYIMKHSSS